MKDLVKEALANYTPEAYVQSNKEVIVDPTVNKPAAASDLVDHRCLILDDQISAMLRTSMARLSGLKCT